MATVAFEGVWKRYGDVPAVRDLNLICQQGEMLALLGPSGCGKSSTLKMAAGVETLSEGELRFDGRPVSALAPGARNIAMVFEDYALYPHLTARENIAFPLRVRGAARAEADRRIDAVIELLGLDGGSDQRVRDLSGGAQQRISIGRALVRDPELILFDEPLSHLDGDQKVQLRGEIKRLQSAADLTSILVTHDQSEAIAMADRVAVMNNGVLEQVGQPEELYDAPANVFVANFIGEPPMNLLPAVLDGALDAPTLRGDGWFSVIDTTTAAALGAARRVTVGIRPEHLTVARAATPGAFLAMVAYHEQHGDSDILTLRLDADAEAPALVAETDGPTGWRIGDAAWIVTPASRAHLFDPETGRNLRADL